MVDYVQFPGSKVLVTGASGFIGSHLCERLCSSGLEVHALSRATRVSDSRGPRFWQGDVAEIERVRAILMEIKPDVIFHLAGDAVGGRELGLVVPLFRSHLMGTVNLLAVASEVGCRRIVLSGSLEEPEMGDALAIPSSPYAAAKWAGNAYARMFHTLYNLPIVILRVFMVYGPGHQSVRKLIPSTILSLLRGEAPKLASGERQIDWVFIKDVVDGFLAAARAADVEGKTIDVGSGQLISIRALVEHLVRLTNSGVKPIFGVLPERPLEQVRVADRKRSEDMLGWKPVTPLEEGLKQTVAWYEEKLKMCSQVEDPD